MGLVAVAVAVVVVRAVASRESTPPVLVPRAEGSTTDVLAFQPGQEQELARAAAFGLSHPLYARSPGGVVATARRTAFFRSLVEQAAAGSGFDPNLLEAIVFLESAGRPDVIAGDDPARASGLTQILAETAENFLGMPVDLEQSRALTKKIDAARERGDTVRAKHLRAERRAIDARFDPERALAGTVRYLTEARRRLGRDDLAIVSYHMGIGNLTNVLRAFAGGGDDASIRELVANDDLSWARVYFDSTPVDHARAYGLLSRLGDDSPTYYWRVLAAEEIMRLFRDDPARLRQLDALQTAKASAEEVLHPPSATRRFSDANDLTAAWGSHLLQPLPNDPSRLWFAIDPTHGELAPRLGRSPSLYRGLRAEALALLVYLADRVHVMSGATRPLQVTSTVRDEEYQDLLRTGNPEATRGYSLHTTGYSFDIRRRYESAAQARAFQFELDNLTARGLITWVREPAAIHVTVSSDAATLVDALLEPAP
jgi:Transglycosylase SLT domain